MLTITYGAHTTNRSNVSFFDITLLLKQLQIRNIFREENYNL